MSQQDEPTLVSFFTEWTSRVSAEYGTNAIAGLSDDEVMQLCEDQNAESLPASYRMFLKSMGRSAGRLLRGTDAFYPSILGLKNDAVELMNAEGVGDLLPDDAFVFAMHQGYQAFWFRLSEGDDPPVYRYQEGDAGIGRVWPTFTGYLSFQHNQDIL